MKNKEHSPFTPGNPVPVELFVGRAEQIQEVDRYVAQSAAGKMENIFLSGERGIGKSSFASFLKYIAASRKDMLAIHVFLGGVTSLPEMVRHISERLLRESIDKSWFSKIRDFFGEHIESFGLFGITAKFNPPVGDLEQLVTDFPEALNNLLQKIRDEKKGIFIALDDVNGLTEKGEFANWYKSMVDNVASNFPNLPVIIMLIGLPEKRDTLSKLQPSLLRIFRVIDIEKLSESEVRTFYTQAFERAGLSVESEAMNALVKISGGLPILMQEIGDAVFWIDNDGIIDKQDAIGGILSAAETVGRKYLDPKVYRAIRSDRYRSILRKLGQLPLSQYFTKKKIEENLNDNEKKVFHNFLRRMRELGILEQDIESSRGTYRFVNQIYPLYIYLESKRPRHLK